MRAITVEAPGEVDALIYSESVPIPDPGPGQVRIKVAYAGLNFFDVLIRSGRYLRKPKYPLVLGGEVAGVVDAVGEGVSGVATGDRVCALPESGGYSEYAVAAAAATIALPAGVTLQQGASYPLQVLTAWGVLFASGRVRQEDWVLVHAAAGGVGSALCQLASDAGCQVIGTAGSDEKVAHALAHGAHWGINYKTEKFPARVKEITGGRGVDRICDSIGKAVMIDNLRCITHFGLIVVFGYSSGNPQYDSMLLWGRSCGITMSGLYHLQEHPELLGQAVAHTLPMVADGRLRLHVGGVYPLKDVREAHARLEGRDSIGKLLLEVDGSIS